MRLLLDTHTFLWFIDDNPRLSSNAKSLLESDNDLLLSTASLWEIAIKLSLGKLSLPEPFEAFVFYRLCPKSRFISPQSGRMIVAQQFTAGERSERSCSP